MPTAPISALPPATAVRVSGPARRGPGIGDAPARPLLVLTHEFPPCTGGIATFVSEVARAAAEGGRDVEVWAPDARGGAEPAWPFPVRRLPIAGTHGLACVTRLGREIISQRRHVRRATVYAPEPGPIEALLWLQFFRALRPRRLLLTFHGSEIQRFAAHPLKHGLLRLLLSRADRVSTLTRFTRQLLLRHYPEVDEKLFLTPGALRPGIADEPLATAPRDDGRLVVLTVGRVHPRKGQLHTLRALAALPPALRARVEYRIAGRVVRPAYDAELRAAAAATDLRVVFHQEVSDDALDRLYDEADVFALTSIDHGYSVEGFGLVYLEAAAHGLPIVAHRVGGVSEAVLDEVTGLLVPPEQPERLTAAFARLLEDAALRRRLGAAGRVWARQHTWERTAELLFGGVESASGAR